MSLDLKLVQVRLPDEVYDALKLAARAHNNDLGEEAREVITESLLGKTHVIKVLAARLSRAVGTDK